MIAKRTFPSLLIVALIGMLTGCTSEAKSDASRGKDAGRTAFPVATVIVPSERVEYAVGAVGSVDAFERVEVTARVAGVVEQVRFREGQLAPKGQPLVEIEPQRYRVAVEAAQAALQRQQAALAEAEAGLQRREAANERNPGLIRGEEIQTWQTRVSTAAAEVAQARSALEQARLNLRDAFVRAPVTGTIETRTAQTGQYVQPGTLLATMVRRDPLLLRFQVPEQDSPKLRVGMAAKFTVGESDRIYTAQITHVSGQANESSRMVPVTALITDPAKSELTPGAFAKVSVPVGATRETAVIPQTAIRPSENGFLAYVVNGTRAEERILQLGMRTANGRVEVVKGVRPGEQLVIRGAEALQDGAMVKVEGNAQPGKTAGPSRHEGEAR